MKKVYEIPEITVEYFTVADVMTSYTPGVGDGGLPIMPG